MIVFELTRFGDELWFLLGVWIDRPKKYHLGPITMEKQSQKTLEKNPTVNRYYTTSTTSTSSSTSIENNTIRTQKIPMTLERRIGILWN